MTLIEVTRPKRRFAEQRNGWGTFGKRSREMKGRILEVSDLRVTS